MLKVESTVLCKDTSGVKIGKCIHVYRGGYTPAANIGDFMLVSVRSKDPHKSISKNKYLAIVVTTKRGKRRMNGHFIRFQSNGIVVMQDQTALKAKKLKGPVSTSLKYDKRTAPVILLAKKWI
jgi:large subunit ribosomal protein L14